MKKKFNFYLIAFACMALPLFSCGDDDQKTKEEEKVYTQNQESAFETLNGKFQKVTTIMPGVEVKGEILTFNRRFDVPKDIKGVSALSGTAVAFTAHGEGHSEDVLGGGALSYYFYYNISESGTTLNIYTKKEQYAAPADPLMGGRLSIKGADEFSFSHDSAIGFIIDNYYRMK